MSTQKTIKKKPIDLEAQILKSVEVIELVPIAKIKPYSHNTKTHTPKQINDLANAIRKEGFNQPILIEKDGTIIKGHGRWEACKLLGLTKIPAYRFAGNKTEAREARIRDNVIALSTPLHVKNLRFEMQDLGMDFGKSLDLKFNFNVEAPAFSMPDDFEDQETENVRTKGLENVMIQIGTFRFPVSIAHYDVWVNKLNREHKVTTKHEVITWIKNKLELN